MTRNQTEYAEMAAAGSQHHLHVASLGFVQPFARIVIHNAENRLAFSCLRLLLPEFWVRHRGQERMVDAIILDGTRRAVEHKDLVKGRAERCDLQARSALATIWRPTEQHCPVRSHREVMLLLWLQNETLLVGSVDSNNPAGPLFGGLLRFLRHRFGFSEV